MAMSQRTRPGSFLILLSLLMGNGNLASDRLFSSAIILGIVPIILAGSSDCPDDKPPPFARVILITFDGVGAERATAQTFSESYGSCNNISEVAPRAFQFYESFGLNMTLPRRDPFTGVTTDVYDYVAHIVEHPTSRALMGSFYEYGEYLDAPVHRAYYRLTVLRDFNGPRGMIKSGSFLYYGVLRIEMNGRDFCIDFWTDVPSVEVHNGFLNYKVFPLTLYNKDWGHGGGTGVLTDEFDTRRRRSYYWVLRFPADGVY